MPNSILWIGLVVLWVFVLFPMLADRHPRIRQHTDAALATRVLHRGDAAMPRTRKGPASGSVRRKHHHSDDPEDRMTRSDDSTTAGSDDEDFDTDTDREHDTESGASAAADPEMSIDTADPGVREAETAGATREDDSHDDRVEAEIDSAPKDSGNETDREGESPGLGESEESPARPRGRAETLRARVPAVRDRDPHEDELDSDDADFVPSRRGRGGYDPEADAIARAARYTFRQRAVLGLVLSTLAFAGGGIAISAGLWTLCALAATVLVGYLAYLRRQVRIEEDIRRRRMARLGGRAREDSEEDAEPAPERPAPDRDTTRTQLRRAVLVEPDDEDPIFENLELFDAATARAARERASGRVRRAVGE